MIPKIIENSWNIAKSFTPEKFWEISMISLKIITSLMSKFTFIRRPQWFYILGVYIWVRWIQKIGWMVDSIMGIPLGQRRNRIVGFPEVRVYNGPRKYMLLNHWDKIFCTPLPFNYSQETLLMLRVSLDFTKEPNFFFSRNSPTLVFTPYD